MKDTDNRTDSNREKERCLTYTQYLEMRNWPSWLLPDEDLECIHLYDKEQEKNKQPNDESQ